MSCAFFHLGEERVTYLCVAQRESGGKKYYTFEFLTQAPNFTRHGLGVVGIAYG